jgi:hypothetical protein
MFSRVGSGSPDASPAGAASIERTWSPTEFMMARTWRDCEVDAAELPVADGELSRRCWTSALRDRWRSWARRNRCSSEASVADPAVGRRVADGLDGPVRDRVDEGDLGVHPRAGDAGHNAVATCSGWQVSPAPIGRPQRQQAKQNHCRGPFDRAAHRTFRSPLSVQPRRRAGESRGSPAPHVCPTDESPDHSWASGQCAFGPAASVLPQLVRRTPTAPTSIRG